MNQRRKPFSPRRAERHPHRGSSPHYRSRRLARIVAVSREEADAARASRRSDRRLARPRRGRSTVARIGPEPRLFTATIAYADGGVMIQAFHASVARHPAEVVQRLRCRFGEDVVLLAELRSGFHPAAPIAISLVPTSVGDMIRQAERNCAAPAALSFAVDIEQRIEI